MRTWRSASLLAVILLLVSAGLVVAATTITLLGYQIDFLGFTNNPDNTSTWTYAVTADGDEEKGLSHWTLGIDACFGSIVAPANGAQYTTKTGAEFGCGTTYNCEAAQCTVVYGIDPTTGVNGIKFEDCSPQLTGNALAAGAASSGPAAAEATPRTQIFQFTVQGQPNEGGPVTVALKPGQNTAEGTLIGPACKPNAVALREFDASNAGTSPQPYTLLAGALVFGLAGIVVSWRSARG